MKIIYQQDNIEIAEFPSHSRTIQFKEYKKFVSIPAGYIGIIKYESILSAILVNKNLDYQINFGNTNLCTNKQKFKTIEEYFSWYWNSKFDCFDIHRKIPTYCFNSCERNYWNCAKLLHILFSQNKEKIKIWAKEQADHIRFCQECSTYLLKVNENYL